MSGGDWGLVGLGGSKHGPQSLTFFFFFFFFKTGGTLQVGSGLASR